MRPASSGRAEQGLPGCHAAGAAGSVRLRRVRTRRTRTPRPGRSNAPACDTNAMQISGHYAAAEVFFFPPFFSRGLVRWLICALQWNERAGSIIPRQNCLFFRRFPPSFSLRRRGWIDSGLFSMTHCPRALGHHATLRPRVGWSLLPSSERGAFRCAVRVLRAEPDPG